MSIHEVVAAAKKTNVRVWVAFVVLSLLLTGIAVAQGHAGDAANPAAQPEAVADTWTRVGAFIAAALVTGLGSFAAGMAVSNVGAAAMGAVAERPELMGKSLIYVALAEGIAIYGLLIAIIILAKV